MRGFYEIGIYHPKSETNVGTLWRTAYQLGASGIFIVGRRYRKQSSDTYHTYRHIPLRNFGSIDELMAALPYATPLIGVEMGGISIEQFSHPQRAVYLLGAEDHGLPESVLGKCVSVVSLSSVNHNSFNVSVAGSIVLYHRCFLCEHGTD